MGWLWGTNESSDGDPLKHLDPGLREFLDRESPVKYKPSAPTPKAPEVPKSDSAKKVEDQSSQDEQKVPRESLFQDGRYAHLWKTYTSQREVEAMCKSDQEKLMDVLAAYRTRRKDIGRAAVENCSDEQADLEDCFIRGNYGDVLVLCRKQKKAHIRCYETQTKFLKALGYLSSFEQEDDTKERIQMHADLLYHRLLAQEGAIEGARKAGTPIPHFPSINSPDQTPTYPTADSKAKPLKPNKKDELPELSDFLKGKLQPHKEDSLRRKLKDMNSLEREMEERSVLEEYRMSMEVAEDFVYHRDKMVEGRKERRTKGKATTFDVVSGWFGW